MSNLTQWPESLIQGLRMGEIRSSDLFIQRQELVIEHAQQHYRLRITGNGKLILTK